jgi:hypothetical protein
MVKRKHFFIQGTGIPLSLTIAGIFGLVAGASLLANSFGAFPQADMRTEAELHTRIVGEEFEVQLVVESSIPVNAFSGDLTFNTDVLSVARIDYNTSIANLWVQEPWYSNGEGTINFAGGTTKAGGFQGTGTLITVTFTTLKEGQGFIGITNARILQHDGLGSETNLEQPIDAIFTIENSTGNSVDVLHKSDPKSTWFNVQKEKPSTDLNADGEQTIADVSIFMMQMVSQNMQSDFNEDGKVSATDLSILLDK